MKMKKQLFYILGATATVATPVVAVVSCGSTKKNTEQHKETTNTQKPQVVVDTATHNQGTEIAGLPGVVSPEDLAAKAQAIDAQIKAAIASFDKAVLAMEEKIDADQEAEIQRRHEEHAKETSAYDAQFANPLKQEKIQTAEEISKHLAHEEEIAKQEAEEQEEYDELKAQQEAAERQARHQAEIDAQNLIDFNNEANLKFELIKEAVDHERHEAELLAQDEFDNMIESAKLVSQNTHNLIRSIWKNENGLKATDAQFEALAIEVSKLDDQLEAMYPNTKSVIKAVSKISSISEEIRIAALRIERQAISSSIKHNNDVKKATFVRAGDFAREFKRIILSTYSAKQLTQVTDGGYRSYPIVNKVNIQKLIKDTLIKFFPELKSEIEKMNSDIFFYSESGGSAYGVRFQMMNYLLNDENFNTEKFSDFIRGKWDQLGPNNAAKFEGYAIGQSHIENWDNKNEYDSEIKAFFMKLDALISIDKQNPPILTTAPLSLYDDVEAFKLQGEDHSAISSAEWVKTAIGKTYKMLDGSLMTIISAEVDEHDATKVICKFDAHSFTAYNGWTTPISFTKTLDGFKKVNEKSMEFIWTSLKNVVPNNIIEDIVINRSRRNDPNHFVNVKENVAKILAGAFGASFGERFRNIDENVLFYSRTPIKSVLGALATQNAQPASWTAFINNIQFYAFASKDGIAKAKSLFADLDKASQA